MRCSMAFSVVLLTMLGFCVTDVSADDVLWDNSSGGPFGLPGNWSPQQVPDTDDTAVFDLDSVGGYGVTFADDFTNARLIVCNDTALLNLGGQSYSLTETSRTDCSIVVGQSAGEVGDLTISSGILEGEYGSIGHDAGSGGTVTVDGVESTWTNGSDLFVGHSGAGTLDITGGGSVTNVDGYIGCNSGSDGAVTVDGDNSTWANGEFLFVGNHGTGTLDITGGGSVSCKYGHIGMLSGAHGTVTVDGVGSTWINSRTLSVGNGGTGTLDITGGGSVSFEGGYLGFTSGDVGTVTVDGADSTWTNSGSLRVGCGGTGKVDITGGGSVSNTYADIGRGSGSDGAVTVDGVDSTWTSGGRLSVGYRGTGTLDISGGGSVSNTYADIGYYSGSVGAVTVDGDNSTWTNSKFLYVGEEGAGTLDITGGGSVSNTLGYIGYLPGADGAVTVDGDNSTWTNSRSTLFVGHEGMGTLDISGGGSVSNNDCHIAHSPGSDGGVTVDGDNSRWANNGSVYVGGHDIAAGGTGMLTVENDGTVTVVGTLKVWDTGTVNLAGGSVTCVTFDKSVGGTFTHDGGTLHVQGGTFDPGTADYTIDGAGSPTLSLTNAVGDISDALVVGNRGAVRLRAGTLHAANLDLQGTVYPIGFASHLLIDDTTTLGNLLVLDGGTFSTGSLVNPQLLDFARGTFNLTCDDLTIGPGGLLGAAILLPSEKTLNVTNNTTIDAAGELELDRGTFASGSLANNGLISGRGTVGGSLNNSPTGTIRANAADALAFAGGEHTNSGQINLIGGTIEFTGPVNNEPAGTISGHGGLLFDDGLTNHGTMNFGTDTEIYGDVANGEWAELGTNGEIVISGGASVSFHGDVASNGAKFKVSENADVVFFGTLSGEGSITGGGGVWIEGTFSPGNSPGEVLFGGDLGLGSDALLQVELGGTEPGVDYDVLNVLGLASLDGTLDVTLLDGFEPAVGDEFDIFNFVSPSGTFDEILLPDLATGLGWDSSQLAATGVLTVVPEPGTFLLAVLGLLAMLVWRR